MKSWNKAENCSSLRISTKVLASLKSFILSHIILCSWQSALFIKLRRSCPNNFHKACNVSLWDLTPLLNNFPVKNLSTVCWPRIPASTHCYINPDPFIWFPMTKRYTMDIYNPPKPTISRSLYWAIIHLSSIIYSTVPGQHGLLHKTVHCDQLYSIYIHLCTSVFSVSNSCAGAWIKGI